MWHVYLGINIRTLNYKQKDNQQGPTISHRELYQCSVITMWEKNLKKE